MAESEIGNIPGPFASSSVHVNFAQEIDLLRPLLREDGKPLPRLEAGRRNLYWIDWLISLP